MPKIVISSMSLYPSHNLSYYCWAEIVDKGITELGYEDNQNSGVCWKSDWDDRDINGDLQECLTDLGRDYGMRFYYAVWSRARKSCLKLLTPKAVQIKIEETELRYVSEEIKNAETHLARSKKKLDRILERRRPKEEAKLCTEV